MSYAAKQGVCAFRMQNNLEIHNIMLDFRPMDRSTPMILFL